MRLFVLVFLSAINGTVDDVRRKFRREHCGERDKNAMLFHSLAEEAIKIQH